jgi:hypothetical protein
MLGVNKYLWDTELFARWEYFPIGDAPKLLKK